MMRNVLKVVLVILVAGGTCGISFLAGRHVGLSSGQVAPRDLPFGKHDADSREAMVTRIVDGDTIDCMVNLGYETLRLVRIRLEGIDTPERGRLGFGDAIYFCESWAEEASQIVRVKVSGKDKYGRYVGRIYRAGDEKDLSQALLDAGLAIPYPRGRDVE